MKYAAALSLRVDPYLSAVQFNERFGDGQSKSGPFWFRLAIRRDLIKLVEDLFTLVHGYAGTRIRNRNPHPIVWLARRRNHHSAFYRRKLDRVADEIGQNLCDLVSISPDQRRRLQNHRQL